MKSESPVRFLLIDTCGPEGRVALTEGDAVVAETVMPGRTYSERLVSAGMQLLAGRRLQDLSAIVVVNGPGSFTGVRVGISAAKGWSEASAVPVIALSRLALLAAQVDGDTIAVLDAGRGEFYCGYRDGERLQTRAELLAHLARAAHPSPITVCEPSVAAALAELVPTLVPEPGSEEMLRLAHTHFEAADFADVATLDANYVRRSDAEIFAKPPVSAKPLVSTKPLVSK